MTTTINLADLPRLIWGYVKAAIGVALVAFIGLTLFKLFGFDPISIPIMDPQSFGVFVAGSAFALSKL
jgi:hypothetical protein